MVWDESAKCTIGICTPKVVAYPQITGLLLGVTRSSEGDIYITYYYARKPRLNVPHFAQYRHQLDRPQPADVPQAGVRGSAPSRRGAAPYADAFWL